MPDRTDLKIDQRRLRRALERLNAALVVKAGRYEIIDLTTTTTLARDLTLDDAERWCQQAGDAKRQEVVACDRPTWDLHIGDARTMLRTLPANHFQCCVSSPPYFSHRDYGHDDQLGQEETPDLYTDGIVSVMEEVRRVLRPDGTAWLVLGDGYNSNPSTSTTPRNQQGNGTGRFRIPAQHHLDARRGRPNRATRLTQQGIKLKDQIGIPWMVAFALRRAGWYWRGPIYWEKPTFMPDNARDRPSQSTEVILLLSRSSTYDCDKSVLPRGNVWRIPPARLPRSLVGEHHAVMPTELARRCVGAGSHPGDHVLDCFAGSGTTGVAARELNRHCTLIEINPKYADLIRRRMA